MFQRGRTRRRKEVDGLYRRGSGIVCAWTDIRIAERRNWNVIWLGSHQDFILRSLLSFRSFLSRPIRTILIALLSATATLLTPYSLVIHLTLSRAIDIVDSKATELILSAILSAMKSAHFFICFFH